MLCHGIFGKAGVPGPDADWLAVKIRSIRLSCMPSSELSAGHTSETPLASPSLTCVYCFLNVVSHR
jgi:hypothetical protein